MTSEDWQQVTELFEAALERDPAERAAFLAQACPGDEAIRKEVASLLAAHEGDSSFMNTPVGNLLVGDKPMLTAGQPFGPYEEISLLGEGGMGQVYLAVDTRLGRKVALKLLPSSCTSDADRVYRFGQEARAASALNHPNIVTIHEIGQTDSFHFIATEFIDGATLREHMTNTRMPADDVLDVAIQIASALQAAHEAGIVHRDIKPENIMLRRDRFVKVLDFGLVKLAADDALLAPKRSAEAKVKTNPGVVMGTAAYMSPEQARGVEVDARTDIWSLGVVLYEMVAGHAPFEGELASHVIVSVLESDPPPLSLAVEVPIELERIITKALRKERAERYQTAADLERDLKSLKEELTVEARLKQFSSSGENGRAPTTKSKGPALKTADASVSSVGFLTRLIPGAAYLLNGIKRHRSGAVFASTAAFFLVASLVYFSNFNKGGNEIIDSVAVLSFVNESNDPETEYLSDGICDSIINTLSRLDNLRVISLSTVLLYKGKQVDPQQVGRDLKVRAVLVGRMTQRGDALAISTELVDARDNRRLWGGQYNRKLSDILAVQDEIAKQITAGLQLQLSGEEKKQLAKQYTENTEAYQAYILGMHYFRKETKEAYEKAIEYFEQAIKKDPNYVLAYLGLARTYHFMGTRGFWPTKESEQNSEWALLKALQLDDKSAEAHARLGGLKFSSFDWLGAEKELKRALELDPNSIQANSAYSQYLAAIGRPDEGIQYALRVQELDPTSEPDGPALAYLLARQYDKAIELFRKRIEKDPDYPHANILLGEAYAAKGMYEESVAAMQKGVALEASLSKTPERWDRYPMLAYAFAMAGRRAEALKILDAQKKLAKQRYVSPYNFALIYTGLGDKDQAFTWLGECIDQRTRLVYRLKARPMFDPLRSDPRYAELLGRMNLEP